MLSVFFVVDRKVTPRFLKPDDWYKGLRREIHVYTFKREMLLRLTFDAPLCSSCSLFVFTGLCLIKSDVKMGETFAKR